MSFVNEHVSQSDLAKYGLDKLWDSQNPRDAGDYFHGGDAELTIDKKTNTFLVPIAQGAGEYSSRMIWILSVKDCNVRIATDLESGTSQSWSDRPFRMVWSLASIEMPSDHCPPKNAVIFRLQ